MTNETQTVLRELLVHIERLSYTEDDLVELSVVVDLKDIQTLINNLLEK